MQDTIVPYAELMLCIEKQLEIKAPIDVVFESLLEEMGPGFQGMNGAAMNLKIEPWPGGRWFRDLGNNTGHLWGHVQVIKPPTLLEINGPMMMSYPAINHVQYRLTSGGESTTLKFTHRAMGDLSPDHRGGVTKGWDQFLGRVKNRATR
jgi:uncharacterized protein YndB with AHSA1/START domain